jgi:hypothetical protein
MCRRSKGKTQGFSCGRLVMDGRGWTASTSASAKASAQRGYGSAEAGLSLSRALLAGVRE